MNFRFFSIVILILVGGCITLPEEPSTTTTIQKETTTLCQLRQERCDGYCEQICNGYVEYCILDPEDCVCKYSCFTATSTSTTSTSTIFYGKMTCDSHCRKIGYKEGACRINSGECRRGVKEVYKPKGDRYCPPGAEDTCCCKI